MNKIEKIAGENRYKFRRFLMKTFELTNNQSNEITELIEKYCLKNFIR